MMVLHEKPISCLVLLLEKEVPGWQRQLLGPEMASPLKLLEGKAAVLSP